MFCVVISSFFSGFDLFPLKYPLNSLRKFLHLYISWPPIHKVTVNIYINVLLLFILTPIVWVYRLYINLRRRPKECRVADLNKVYTFTGKSDHVVSFRQILLYISWPLIHIDTVKKIDVYL